MSHVVRALQWTDPVGPWGRLIMGNKPITARTILDPGNVLGHHSPSPSPGVPNPNDAANAAQSMTDQMRMRRGLLANIYAGAGGSGTPVTGKTQLGT